jgi:hypothetical protein
MLPPHATAHARARRSVLFNSSNSRRCLNPSFIIRGLFFLISLLLLAQIYSHFPSFTAWVFGSSSASIIYYDSSSIQKQSGEIAQLNAIASTSKEKLKWQKEALEGKPVDFRTVLRKQRLRISTEKKKPIDDSQQLGSSSSSSTSTGLTTSGSIGSTKVSLLSINVPRDTVPKNNQVLGKPVNWADKIVPKSWKMFTNQLPESEDAKRQRQRDEDELRAKKELAEEELRSKNEAERVAERRRVRKEAQRLKIIELEAVEAAEKRREILQGAEDEIQTKAAKEKVSFEKKLREEEEKKSYLSHSRQTENSLKLSVEEKKARAAERARVARQAAIEAVEKADQAEKEAVE